MDSEERGEALAAMHRDLLKVHLESVRHQGEALRGFLEASRALVAGGVDPAAPAAPAGAIAWPEVVHEWEYSAAADAWIVDHTPLWTVPVLPLTALLDMACQAAAEVLPGEGIPGIASLEARSWCDVPEGGRRGRTIRRSGAGDRVDVEIQVQDPEARDGYRTCVVARLRQGSGEEPPRPARFEGPAAMPCPYAAGKLFHGPAFQLMSDLVEGEGGAAARVAAASRGVPYGLVHPGLLDASLHAVPFLEIARWYPELGAGKVAFPYRLRDFDMLRAPPRAGSVEVQVRRVRVEHGVLPVVGFWISDEVGVLARFELTLALVPLGPLAGLPVLDQRRFLARQGAVDGLPFSLGDGAERGFDVEAFEALGWLPQGGARIFGVDPGTADLHQRVAARCHAGDTLALHPSRIVLGPGGACANVSWNQLEVLAVSEDPVRTRSRGPAPLDLAEFYRGWGPLGAEPSLVKDVATVLLQRLVRRVVLEDPADWGRRHGAPVLYLANHQVAIESFLLCLLGVGLGGTPCYGITRTENIGGVLGALLGMQELVLGAAAPLRALAFDSEDPAEFHQLLAGYREAAREHGASLYAAVEGQRVRRAGRPVERVSSVFFDLSIEEGIPIVPVRLAGALPREPVPEFLELPFQLAGQDYYMGAAIDPGELAGLPLGERRRLVLSRMNSLGPEHARERPNHPDPEFAARVSARAASGVGELGALLLEGLAELREPSAEAVAFLRVAAGEAEAAEAGPIGQALLAFLGPGAQIS